MSIYIHIPYPNHSWDGYIYLHEWLMFMVNTGMSMALSNWIITPISVGCKSGK